MKQWLALCLAYFCIPILCASDEEYRTWTDLKDRTMKARFIELRLPNVYLQRDDEQFFEFPLKQLSDADRRYIEHKLALQYAMHKPLERWTKIKKQVTSDKSIRAQFVGRYREIGKYLVIELTIVKYDIPRIHANDFGGTNPWRVRPRIRLIDPDEDDKRWRSFFSRDSDKYLRFQDDPKQDRVYEYWETPLEMQTFNCFIPNWARKGDQMQVGIEAHIGDNYWLYVPVGDVIFENEALED